MRFELQVCSLTTRADRFARCVPLLPLNFLYNKETIMSYINDYKSRDDESRWRVTSYDSRFDCYADILSLNSFRPLCSSWGWYLFLLRMARRLSPGKKCWPRIISVDSRRKRTRRADIIIAKEIYASDNYDDLSCTIARHLPSHLHFWISYTAVFLDCCNTCDISRRDIARHWINAPLSKSKLEMNCFWKS